MGSCDSSCWPSWLYSSCWPLCCCWYKAPSSPVQTVHHHSPHSHAIGVMKAARLDRAVAAAIRNTPPSSDPVYPPVIKLDPPAVRVSAKPHTIPISREGLGLTVNTSGAKTASRAALEALGIPTSPIASSHQISPGSAPVGTPPKTPRYHHSHMASMDSRFAVPLQTARSEPYVPGV